MKSLLLEAADKNPVVDVDLAAVSSLDSAALQVLLLVERTMREGGRELRFIEPSAAVRDVFELIGLSEQLSMLVASEPGFGFF